MGATANAGAENAATEAGKLGLTTGNVVQEFGWDDDVDEDVRVAIETITGEHLVDEDHGDVSDVAIVWWRAQDGDLTDLTDMLVDAQTVLDDGGCVWVLTPKAGRPGHVLTHDIAEASTTAGLHATTTFSVAASWTATKLDTRGRGR